jgi:hypothetical protein
MEHSLTLAESKKAAAHMLTALSGHQVHCTSCHGAKCMQPKGKQAEYMGEKRRDELPNTCASTTNHTKL